MADHLPFDWYIRPTDPDIVCPSPSRILGTFAIINGVVSLFSILAGHHDIVKFVTRGWLGGDGSNKPWRYMCIVPVLLQLFANFIIAHIMKSAPGYDAHYASWELMLFYTARPRLTFFGLAVASLFPKTRKDYQKVSPNEENHMQPWTSSCISNMIGEVLLQLIALYIMGTTVRYGVENNYYIFRSPEYESLGHFTHVFYGGALYYLIAGVFFLGVALKSLYKIDIQNYPNDKKTSITCAIVILITTWLGSWLFWAGFVFSAGNNYCPPNLISHAVVWSLFSSIGIFLGVGP